MNVADCTILFVDDEPNVLQGLRRMLRHKRDVWDMRFALGATEALVVLGDRRVDVVVTDMRMPDIDGAQLLKTVTREYPETVRFVLSGQCDEETALRSVGVSHQYLSKPCDGAELEAKIGRALGLRAILNSGPLRRMVAALPSIPSRPTVYTDLVNEFRREQSQPDRIDEIVAQDPGLAAKVLQLCNSAYFGLSSQVRSIHQATHFLGLDTLKSLALCYGIVSQLRCTMVGAQSVDEVIEHSMLAGTLARQIARSSGFDQYGCDDAYAAGLMHDIGTLILADNFGAEYGAALTEGADDGTDRAAVERAAFGADHAAVGAYLLGTWGLPDPIVEAVAYHHRAEPHEAGSFDSATIIHIVEGLIEESDAAEAGSVVAGARLSDAVRARPEVAAGLPKWGRMLEGLQARTTA